MKKTIGGIFGIDPGVLLTKPKQPLDKFFGLSKDYGPWLNLGRGCLNLLFEDIVRRQQTILLPDYLCGDIFLSVLKERKAAFEFYPVNRDLEIEGPINAGPSAAVLVINYFGIVDHHKTIAKIRKSAPKAVIIQDCVQDPYYLRRVTRVQQPGDFAFTSFKKAFPVTEGACIRAKKKFIAGEIEPGDPNYFKKSLEAGVMKEQRGDEVAMLRSYEESRKLMDNKPREATAFARDYLTRLDLAKIAKQRRDNYRYLVEKLRGVSVVKVIKPSLGAKDVPLFCPIHVQGEVRNRLRQYLQKERIFCPVHWPVPPEMESRIGAEAKWMSEHMLSLVIDQRYTKEDMDRLAEVIKNLKYEKIDKQR